MIKDENEIKAIKTRNDNNPLNPAFPVRMIFNTTYRCNLRCKMCFLIQCKKFKHLKNKVLPFDVFNNVCKETLPFAKEIKLTVSGEPLLTPYFNKIPDILQEYRVKLNLTTNGTLLNRKISKQIMPFLSDLKISLDGASKNTYEKIRVGANFNKVIKNTKTFLEERELYLNTEQGNHIPTVTFQIVLMTENIKELPKLVKLAHKLGVDRVKAYHMLVYNRSLIASSLLNNVDNKRLTNRMMEEASILAKNYNIEIKFPKPFVFETQKINNPKKQCHFLWQEGWIDVNGDVITCCTPGRPVVGNVINNSFLEIWNNKVYRDIRERLNTSNSYKCCKNCAIINEFQPNSWNYNIDSFYYWGDKYSWTVIE